MIFPKLFSSALLFTLVRPYKLSVSGSFLSTKCPVSTLRLKRPLGFSNLYSDVKMKHGRKSVFDMMGGKHGGGDGRTGRGMVPLYSPRTENQKQYVQMLESKENKIVLVLGPAGTGKTLFACLAAIRELRAGNIEKIVLTRPAVTVEEDLGFLPGNIKSKMDPWTRPIFDVFLEHYHQREIDSMIQAGIIEISPLAFMRGRTFKRCFILADEMQNSSPNQMIMVTTRIGEGSQMVINGDLRQSDLGRQNGLEMFVQKIKQYSQMGKNHTGIAVCSMKYEDIERSPVVSMVLDILGPMSSVGTNNTREAKVGSGGIPERRPWTNREDGSNDAALIPLSQYKNID
jgi:phosphate starvation-inducible PhoH-like protein